MHQTLQVCAEGLHFTCFHLGLHKLHSVFSPDIYHNARHYIQIMQSIISAMWRGECRYIPAPSIYILGIVIFARAIFRNVTKTEINNRAL